MNGAETCVGNGLVKQVAFSHLFLPPPDCSIPKELPLSLTKRPHKKLWHRDFRGFDPFENGSAGESTGSNYLWLIILNSDFFYHRAIMHVGRPGSEQVL